MPSHRSSVALLLCCRSLSIFRFFSNLCKFNLFSFHDSGAEWKIIEWRMANVMRMNNLKNLTPIRIAANWIFCNIFADGIWFYSGSAASRSRLLWFLSNFNIYGKCFRKQLLLARICKREILIDMLNRMPIWIQIVIIKGCCLLPRVDVLPPTRSMPTKCDKNRFTLQSNKKIHSSYIKKIRRGNLFDNGLEAVQGMQLIVLTRKRAVRGRNLVS